MPSRRLVRLLLLLLLLRPLTAAMEVVVALVVALVVVVGAEGCTIVMRRRVPGTEGWRRFGRERSVPVHHCM